MLPPFGAAHPHILIHVITLAFLNRFVRYLSISEGCMAILRGQGEETNVEANNNSGGRGVERPVGYKIPLGVLIFLVFDSIESRKLVICSDVDEEEGTD